MSPFFSNPQFIAATHEERVRRLHAAGRLRRDDGKASRSPRLDDGGTGGRRSRRNRS